MKQFIIATGFICCSIFLSAQNTSNQVDENEVIRNLKGHITALASDKYEGRETGTKGETLSYQYIMTQFRMIGLEPKGTEGYIQPFPFTKGTEIGKKTTLSVGQVNYKLIEDFYPLAYSANASAEGNFIKAGFGISAPALGYDDYKTKINRQGAIFVIELSRPEASDPHSKFEEYADIRQRIDKAVEQGASGIIFINSDKNLDSPKQDFSNKITPCKVPVVFAKGLAYKTFMDGTTGKVKLTVELNKIEGKGHNVIGYIDNRQVNTVIIGAHYDHLGFGGDESLYRGEPAIHNGADDNASGTAALIELARQLIKGYDKSNNYLFMAFSGEEKGLLGSNYFVKHPTISLAEVSYMINMDMVGRLKPEDPVLIINGVGTSPSWNEEMKDIKIDSLKIKTSESGVGPSDHTSFYLDSIPVLHFFSGTHSDYHKPSDDENLINYKGEFSIIKYILTLVDRLNAEKKLTFVKTKDSGNDDAPRFKVTLGVVPDYAFDGEGMRIDGVSDGKPASRAGLLKGDVVVQLGEIKVLDMMSYMKALGKFSKGETTKVKVKRGEDLVEKDITF